MPKMMLLSNPRTRRRRRTTAGRRMRTGGALVVRRMPSVIRVRRRRRTFGSGGGGGRLQSLLSQAAPLGLGFAGGLYLPKLIFKGKDRTPTAYAAMIGAGIFAPMVLRMFGLGSFGRPVALGLIASQIVKIADDLLMKNSTYKAFRDDVELLDYAGDEEILNENEEVLSQEEEVLSQEPEVLEDYE